MDDYNWDETVQYPQVGTPVYLPDKVRRLEERCRVLETQRDEWIGLADEWLGKYQGLEKQLAAVPADALRCVFAPLPQGLRDWPAYHDAWAVVVEWVRQLEG
jgi:hypothetical protein